MTIHTIYLNNAIKIGDELLGIAESKSDFLSWKNLKKENRNNIAEEFDYSLSTGTTGIIFFYAELYNITKDEKYLEIIRKAVNGLQKNLSNVRDLRFGIWNGIAGVVIMYIKLFRVTSNTEYLSLAKEYCSLLTKSIESDNLNNSLFEGRSGALLGMLNLYLVTNDSDLIYQIIKIVRKIFWDARYDQDGLNWYHSPTQASGLTGFGFGSVGISYALSLLSAYAHCDAKLKVHFEGGFNYCYNQWNHKIRNWPDFNVRVESETDDKNLINRFSESKGRRSILNGRNEVNFSDGFLGILFGLSIVERFTTINEKLKIFVHESASHLCNKEHSIKSILDYSALLSIKLLLNENIDEVTPDIRINCSTEYAGLSDGLAGLGYWNLIASGRIANPYFSFFLGELESLDNSKGTTYISEKLKLENLYLIPYFKHYPKTLEYIGREGTECLIKGLYPRDLQIDFTIFHNLIKKILKSNPKNYALRRIYRLESVKHKYFLKNRMSVIAFVNGYQSFVANRNLQNISNSEILKKRFVLNSQVRIINSKYDIYKILNGSSEKDVVENEDTFILLQNTDTEAYIRDENLTDMNEIIINFKEPIVAGAMLDMLVKQQALEDRLDAVRKQFITVILKYVQSGVLIVVN